MRFNRKLVIKLEKISKRDVYEKKKKKRDKSGWEVLYAFRRRKLQIG